MNDFDLMTAGRVSGSIPLCGQELGKKQAKDKGLDI